MTEPGHLRLASAVDVSSVEIIGSVLAGGNCEAGELVVDLIRLRSSTWKELPSSSPRPAGLVPDQQVTVIRTPRSFRRVLEALGWRVDLEVTDDEGTQ